VYGLSTGQCFLNLWSRTVCDWRVFLHWVAAFCFCSSVSPAWSSSRCPLHVLSSWNPPTHRTRSLCILRQTAQVLMQPNFRNPLVREGTCRSLTSIRPTSGYESSSVWLRGRCTVSSTCVIFDFDFDMFAKDRKTLNSARGMCVVHWVCITDWDEIMKTVTRVTLVSGQVKERKKEWMDEWMNK